ncbi:TSUP family transporter [Methanocaldococcus sp. 10A]
MVNLFLFIPLFTILGFIIGILASLCGLGGGFLVAPILALVFDYLGIPNGIKFAIGTSLFIVFINSIVSFIRHANFKNIEWKAIITLGVIGFIFSKLSSYIVVNFIDAHVFKKIFGLFLIIIEYI